MLARQLDAGLHGVAEQQTPGVVDADAGRRRAGRGGRLGAASRGREPMPAVRAHQRQHRAAGPRWWW